MESFFASILDFFLFSFSIFLFFSRGREEIVLYFVTTLAVKKAIATERAMQKGSKELFSIQIAAQNELLYGKKLKPDQLVFGKNSDSKTDQAEDNLSTVSCSVPLGSIPWVQSRLGSMPMELL